MIGEDMGGGSGAGYYKKGEGKRYITLFG